MVVLPEYDDNNNFVNELKINDDPINEMSNFDIDEEEKGENNISRSEVLGASYSESKSHEDLNREQH